MSDAGGAAGAGAGGGNAGGAGGAGNDALGGAGGGAGGAGGAGGQANQFLASLPEEFRGDPMFASFNDVGGLAKSFKEARGMIGADTIKLPGKDAKPEDWGALWNKLGRPENPDGYKIEGLQLPEGVRDEAFEKVALAELHKLGLSNAAVNGLFKWFYGHGVEGAKARAAEAAGTAAKNMTALEQEFGSAFGERAAMVGRLFTTLKGGDVVREKLRAAGLGTDPDIFRFFDQVGQTMVEGRHIDGLADHGLAMTAEQAKAKIEEIKATKGHPAYDESHADHKKAAAELERLYAAAYGTKPVPMNG